MWLIRLAWKNLWRNRQRTLVTISSIFFAVILSVTANSFQDGVFDHFIKNMVGFYTGYVQIHQAGYWDKQVLDNSLEIKPGLEEKIGLQQNITAIAPRIESYALASFGELTKGCMIVGISPEEEDRITSLKSKVVSGTYFTITNSLEVMLSEGLAKRLNIRLADTLYLIGQGYHGSMAAGKYTVKALVKFGSPELNDQLLFMPLNTAQEFFSAPGLLTSYVLGLTSDSELENTVSALRVSLGSGYEVMSWKEILPDVDQHIKTDKASMYIIQGILYILICFGIFGTLLMMVAERKYEMGMLTAIGMKKRKLIGMLVTESVLTVTMGCIIGLMGSIPIVYYLNKYPLRFEGEFAEMYEQFGFEAVFPTSLDPAIFITQGIVVIILGLVLSLYPVVKVLVLDPVTAMKK